MCRLAILSLLLSLVLAARPVDDVRALDDELVFPGVAEGDATGFAVAAGDLDGDGVADLVVGAPCHAAAGEGAGGVHVIYGPIDAGRPLAEADATLLGDERGDFTGEEVGVADLDGDGDAELLVGSPGPLVGAGPLVEGCFAAPVQPGVNRPGEVYVFHGGARLSGASDARSTADAVLTGATPGDFFGMDVDGPGDLDGDGDADLVVGAHGPGTLPAGGGAAYVFDDPISGEIPAHRARAVLLGERPGDLAGVVVEAADLDGDGSADLLVSAPGHALPPAAPSRVYLLRDVGGGPGSLAMADAVFEGTVADDFAGRAVAAGVLTGGAGADLVIGAPGSDTVHIVAGGTRHEGTVALSELPRSIDGPAGQSFGHAVTVLERRGGAAPALVIGGPAAGAPERSGVVAVFGSIEAAERLEDADRRYTGGPGGNAGYSLAAADVDGDGLGDLVVGAPALDGDGPGSVYLIPGSPGPGQRPAPPVPVPPAVADASPAVVHAAARGELPATGRPDSLAAVLLPASWFWLRTVTRSRT